MFDLRKRRNIRIYVKSLAWALLISVLPSIAFLTFSYRQTIAHNTNILEKTIEEATLKLDRLLETADVVLARLAADIEDPSNPEALNLLRRTVYNDPRFREAGIIDDEGLLVLTSLGLVEPPIQIPEQERSDPAIQSLQVIGPEQTDVMQEESLVLSLPTNALGEVNLLVDPKVLAYYLDAVNEVHTGPDGYIAFIKSDGTLIEADGFPPPQENLLEQNGSGRIRAQRASRDGHFIVVGDISIAWALNHWRKEVLFAVPLTVLSSILIVFLFVSLLSRIEGLDGDLKIALENQEFEIHYQPIVDLQSGRCIGCEALMRWRHPEEGMLRPDVFISLAEKTGFIIPLGEWAITQVLSDCQKLFKNHPDFYISINLSPVQINFDSIKTITREILDKPGELQNRIVFEVTESTIIEESNTISPDTIARLRSLGFRIALDDFGTGYSSIRYLQKFEFDYVKIDRLFVGSIGRDSRTGILLDTLIEIGHKLDLAIIAEGIETDEQRQALLQRSVRVGQGWLYSRPLPLDDFERFLHARSMN